MSRNTTLFRWAFILFAACAWQMPLFSQKLDFERLSSELGLSQNMVNCLLQDTRGFLWVGTKDGLNRFDGYRFTTFRYDPFDSLSLSGNVVENMLLDSHGRFWVSTDKGINLFDPEKEVFYNLKTISSSYPLVEDPQGAIWQGGTSLLRLYLPPGVRSADSARIDYFAIEDFPNEFTTTPVWDAAGRGFTSKIFHKAYRFRFDTSRKTIRFDQDFSDVPDAGFFDFLEKATGETNRFFNRFGQGRDRKIWMSDGKELFCWDARAGRYTSIPVPDVLSERKEPNGDDWDYLSTLLEDRRGRLWLGGFAGTFRVYLADKTIQSLNPEPTELSDPLIYGVASVIEDRGGLVWLGTRGNGLLKFNDNAQRFAQGLWRGQSIRSLYKTTDGRIWLAPTQGGLFRLDPQTQQFMQISPNARFFGESIGNVYQFYQDKQGNLWLCSGSWGLVKVSNWQHGEPEIKAWRTRKVSSWIGWYAPVSISVSGQYLWLACPDALRCFNTRTETFETFPFFPENEVQHIERNTFPSIFYDRRGNLWVGTSEGLWRFDPAKKTFEKFQNDRKNPGSLSHDLVKCIAEDPLQPERYLWVGTGGGLNCLDMDTGAFEKFSEKDGLPDQVIYSILSDAAGNLWMSTNKGIAVFDLKRRAFRTFDQRDGLQNLEFNTLAWHKSPDGQMFFGGIGGFNAFYPERMLQANSHVPNIVFTDFKISNRSVSHKTPGSPLSVSIAYARKIVLPHDVKIISFEFAALDFSDPSKNRFACKMEGFDADWQQLGTTHSATYTNLAPGTYTFRVRGSNNDGLWNEAGASIEIVILTPWWATWWAYSLYAMLIGVMLYAFYHLQMKRNQAKAEAIRLQDLNEAKSQFLSTVSHELRTPLTSIMGFSKIIRKRVEERILPNLDRSDPKTERAAGQVLDNLDIVISESERLTALINDVLDLAKIESGKIIWRDETLDIADLVDRAAAATSTLFEAKNIPLRLQIEPGLPKTTGDPDRLLQVLVNLLSNAVKFTEQGMVTCSAYRQSENTLRITVTDTGPGVPEAFREQIFEKFRQATNDTMTDKPRGTGLGLAISKEIVERHGGRIGLESPPPSEEKGSVFWFTLPVR